MQQLTDLPVVGGNVSSVAFLDDQTLVAVIDNKIATVPINGGSPTILYSNANFQSVVVGGSKEIYALSDDALWVMDNISTAPKKSSVYTRNGQTLNVYLNVGPNGQAYLRVLSYPTVMRVYTSADKGQTWVQYKVPTEAEYGGGLAFGPGKEVYVSSPTSFYSSIDGGANWTRYSAVVPNYGGELLVRKNGDVIYYIPKGGGLWTSSNKGASFTNLTPFNAEPFYSVIHESSDGVLYAILSPSSSPLVERASRLMKSVDGKTWTHVMFAEGRDLAMQGSVIAVGMSSGTTGGIAISNDMGASFRTTGTQAVQTISSFAWNSDAQLCILADKGIFAKTSAGWISYGNSVVFGLLTSAGDGTLYSVGMKTSYISSNSGKSWSEVAMPAMNLTSGTGSFSIPLACGLNQHDAIVSRTYYRTDLGKHTNGTLTKLSSSGTASTIQSGNNYVWMAQDGTGRLYARTDNFATNQQSPDNGTTWTEVTTAAPGFVFNHADKYIGYGSGSTYKWGTLGSTTTATLNLDGFSSLSNYISSARFDSQNKLYILTLDKGIFYATQAWN